MYNPDNDLSEIISAIHALNLTLPPYIARDGIEKKVSITIIENDNEVKYLSYKINGMWPFRFKVEENITAILHEKCQSLGLTLAQSL